MIRKCGPSDVAFLFELARKFNAELNLPALDEARSRETFAALIYSPHGVVLRGDSAAILGVLVEDPFRDRVYLQEIGWYAEKGSADGMRLLAAFQDAGKQAGAHAVHMATMQHKMCATARTVLQRRGYTELENVWVRNI